MKISELKHNHSLTDLLKVILFSIVMLLPFFNVLTRSLYVVCNKNAYQSYYGETINEEIKNEGFVNYETYYELIPYNLSYSDYTELIVSDFHSKNVVLTKPDNLVYKLVFYIGADAMQTRIDYTDNTTQYIAKSLYSNTAVFNFYIQSKSNNYLDSQLTYYTYNKDSYLDNVFEYSLAKLETSELYNWTMQTAIYTGVSTMTTQLGITGNIIPIIVCYWFFMTIIYIIIDIILSLFKLLTHMFSKKTN